MVSKMVEEKHADCELKVYFICNTCSKKSLNKRFSLKVMDDVEVLTYDEKCLIIPSELQGKLVLLYHCYLMHPGHT